jgi:hypothetical protein
MQVLGFRNSVFEVSPFALAWLSLSFKQAYLLYCDRLNVIASLLQLANKNRYLWVDFCGVKSEVRR